MPSPEQSPTRVLTVLSAVIERRVARNHSFCPVGSRKGISAFDGARPPSISIRKYLERIYNYTNCSPSCFVVGYVYIDRLLHINPDSLLLSLNVHRLLVTCVMVAAKMLDDVHYNNAFYARVGGVSNSEINRLEVELLLLLDFKVMVSFRIFRSYCFLLEKEMLRNSASQRIERNTLCDCVDDSAAAAPEESENIGL